VWQKADSEDVFMWYSTAGSWSIGSKDNMEAGTNAAWLKVESAALTPEKCTEEWSVAADGGLWECAPEVRVAAITSCSAAAAITSCTAVVAAMAGAAPVSSY
jgi:hypothetical protein